MQQQQSRQLVKTQHLAKMNIGTPGHRPAGLDNLPSLLVCLDSVAYHIALLIGSSSLRSSRLFSGQEACVVFAVRWFMLDASDRVMTARETNIRSQE